MTMLPIAYLTGFYADRGAPPLSSSGSLLPETNDSILTRESAIFAYNPTPNGPTFAHVSTTSSTLDNGDSLSNNDKKMEFGLIIQTLNGCKYPPTVRYKQSLDSFNSKSTVMSSDPTLQGSKFNEDCIDEYKVNYSGGDALYKDNYDEPGVSFTINNVSMLKKPEPSRQISFK
ncbi:19801_t:CDS:2, partial [Racocetra fulgida]